VFVYSGSVRVRRVRDLGVHGSCWVVGSDGAVRAVGVF
jgi:hypothetical protein